jgi:uncharacterized membrane protein YdjX (TVP38/TMEM64 family)
VRELGGMIARMNAMTVACAGHGRGFAARTRVRGREDGNILRFEAALAARQRKAGYACDLRRVIVVGGTTKRDATRVVSTGRDGAKKGSHMRAKALETDVDDDVLLEPVAATTEHVVEASGAAVVKAKSSNVGYILGGLLLLTLATTGVIFREELVQVLGAFVEYIDALGPLGYVFYFVGYVVLETFAVPAFPLTMSAGALFGTAQGTLLVTSAATVAAGIAFLIARYIARDKVQSLAEGYPKFKAIDKALENDSFRVVAVMRLSPLMPFALSNYLYGLTSVNFKSYICGSFLGMMPGTFAYVSAGQATRQLSEGALGSGAILSTLFGVGLAIFSAGYIGKLASNAMCEETCICEEDFNVSASQDT